MPRGRLSGKVGIVTGAGSGIGEVAALLMVGEGAAAVVADINLPAAECVATPTGEKPAKLQTSAKNNSNPSQGPGVATTTGS
jgi:NAD(P)-dependent dehydrogenase (short-subunit alcohol dehydrogenase family)